MPALPFLHVFKEHLRKGYAQLLGVVSPDELGGIKGNKKLNIVEGQTILPKQLLNKGCSLVNDLLLVFGVEEAVYTIDSPVGFADAVNNLKQARSAGDQHETLAIPDEYRSA